MAPEAVISWLGSGILGASLGVAGVRCFSLNAIQQKWWLGSIGMLFGALLPAWFAYAPPPSYTPPSDWEQRRTTHFHIQTLERTAYRLKTNPEAWLAFATALLTEERFAEAAQAFSQTDKISPLSDKDRLRAAEALLQASGGVLVPKAKAWLESIPRHSPFYSRATDLLKSYTFP